MASLKGMAGTAACLWVGGTVVLGMVGADDLSRSWSNLWSTEAPEGVGTVVGDVENIGPAFSRGLNGAQSDNEGAPAPAPLPDDAAGVQPA